MHNLIRSSRSSRRFLHRDFRQSSSPQKHSRTGCVDNRSHSSSFNIFDIFTGPLITKANYIAMMPRGLRFLGRSHIRCCPTGHTNHITTIGTRRFTQKSNLRQQASTHDHADTKQKNTSTLFVRTDCGSTKQNPELT